jgi:hypothetical protein
MNLNEFKILQESDDEYELSHPNGKPFRVKKKGLNEKSHALIQKLKGRKNFAEGGEVASDELNIKPPDGMYFDSPTGQYLENPETGRDAAAKYFTNDQSAQGPEPDYVIKGAPVVGQILDSPGGVGDTQSTVATPESQSLSEAEKPKEAAPVAATPQDSQDMLSQKQSGVNAALEKQKGYEFQIGQAQADQEVQQAKAIDQVQSKVNAMATQQDLVNQYKLKDDSFMKMLEEKKIDPNRYLNNMSTGAKISQGIALVLGGIGAGLTGQPNAALGLLKDNIDRDIEAQKNDQSNVMNLWKMNRERLGDDLSANLATQNQLYTGLKYNMMKAAAQSGSKIAQARAGMAISQIDQQLAQNRVQQSMIQIGLGKAPGMQGADPSVLVPQLVPKEHQAKALSEIEAAQKTKISAPGIMEAFDKAAKDSRVMSGGSPKNLIPGVESAYNKELEAKMGPTFSDIEGTVRQAAMDNMAKNTHPQAFDSDETIKRKRIALQAYLKSKESAPTARAYGIDLGKFDSTHFKGEDELQTMNGVTYKKVPGGWEKVK